MRNVIGVALLAWCLGPVLALAEEGDNEPCGKNHFILSLPVPCPATFVSISAPRGIVADAAGNVYFSSENSVFRLDPSGLVQRIAGTGTWGFSGDGGPAVQAQMAFPSFTYDEYMGGAYEDGTEIVGALALDGRGGIYVTDAQNLRIRRIRADGTIETAAGGGLGTEPGFWSRFQTAVFELPQGIAVGSDGGVVVSDVYGIVRRFDANGMLATVVGENCWVPSRPGVCMPEAMTSDGAGGAYFVERTCQVRHFAADGTLTIVSGEPVSPPTFSICGYSGDGGPASGAMLGRIHGIARDADGALYLADSWMSCIRRIDPSGIIETFAGQCGAAGFSGDGGDATKARLDTPYGVAVGADGTVFIADTGNKRVRAVTPDGVIRTIAGNGL